jgi:non-ribosomal peptide synthetase component F
MKYIGLVTYGAALDLRLLLCTPRTVCRLAIKRMADHFIKLLEGVIDAPDQIVTNQPMLTASEEEQFAQWKRTVGGYPRNLCIHTAFEVQAALTPEHTAPIVGERRLIYCNLNQRSSRLAQRLIQEGVIHGNLIGVFMASVVRDSRRAAGCLKAGAAYVPLDRNQPALRLQFRDGYAGHCENQESL